MGKKYKKSPIIEALCEFHFGPDTSWDLTKPGLIYEEIQDTFPKRFQLQLQATQINLSPTDNPEITGQVVPLMRFQRTDDLALIQVAPNLLTVNHLKPYPSWEEFLPLIKRGLDTYRNVVNPTSIQRIALHYINRIEVPGAQFALEKYFELRPFLGSEKLQNIKAFTLGIQIPYDNDSNVLALQLSSISSGDPNVIAILFDLNYFLVKQGDILWENLSDWLKAAHDRIEEIFEASITKELRKVFEEIVQ